MNSLRSRFWLLAALLAALAPHLGRLPWWLLLLLTGTGLWRLPAVERKVPLPGKWLMVLLLLSGVAGIRASYHTWFGPEAGVAFLIFCLAMKLLESRNERDHYILLVLSLFVLATNFLFGQGVMESAYCLFALIIITSAFLQANTRTLSSGFVLRKSAVMIGQAVPLMIVLFMFFPRLPPLWSMKLTDSTGRTGMSDSMSPGDLANLGRSGELAFRVEFAGGRVPAKRTLYWRGLTFSRFDGKTWRPSVDFRMGESGLVAWNNLPLPIWTERNIRIRDTRTSDYRVILEPTDHQWLYSLTVSLSTTPNIGLTRDFMLINRDLIYQRLTYDAQKYNVVALDPQLPDWMRQENLMLPRQGNPVAREMARTWRDHYGSDGAYIEAVLRWFRKSAFHYTLEPPPLGDNRVDEFLFKTRRGFCEHYSSSFAFLLRAAGIPARVVVGYQGGESSPTGDSWEVRQMDAHAWVEAWIPDRGWVQYDPTSAVAPERIAEGMSAIADQRELWGNSALSAVRYSNHQLLGDLRGMMDYVNYRWQKDVVGFDSQNQEEFLMRLLGDTSLWRQIGVMFGSLALIAAMLASWTLLRHRRVMHPADRLLQKLSSRYSAKGLSRRPGEGVLSWLDRLAEAQPHCREQARAFARSYSRLRYEGSVSDSRRELRQLARLLRSWPSYRPQKLQLVDSPLAGKGESS
jgi:transglutaminase-like putative cysteine protease